MTTHGVTTIGWADLAAEDRPWQDIPGVAVVGLLMGLAFIIVAIRFMFRRKK